MFIPTTYTGKGKPVAFFPETTSAGDEVLNGSNVFPKKLPPKMNFLYVSAYWHEIKNGKHIVCYGIVEGILPDKDFPDGVDNPNFSFGAFLEAAYSRDTEQSNNKPNCWVGFTALHKLGHSKPWNIEHEPSSKFSSEAAYDPQVLANMITNPSQVPVGAIGWFKLAASK
jgi:hypothetical protein